ncbi:MAG: Hsp33 family molecular chaperone HslO, partial [Methylocystaceae bacterium]
IVGDLVAVAEPEGTARLFVENPGADLPSKRPGKLDVGGLVGTDGVVRVIKDMGLKQPFIGSVPLQSGEIADDIAYYLLLSEQIPSIVALGVLVDKDLSVLAAGGLLIQALPGASDDKLAWIEERVNSIGALSSLVKDHELEAILSMIMGDSFEVLERLPLAFCCRCSQEKVEAIIRTLPDEEVSLSLQELGMIEVRCNFCNDTYTFNKDKIDAIRINP